MLKSIKVLIAFFLFQVSIGYSQNSTPIEENLSNSNAIISNPASNILVSTDLQTGRPTVILNLLDIRTNNYTIPIKLGYQTSGVKVSERSGATGLSWNISTGGNISRIVKGLPDDLKYGMVSNNNSISEEVAALDAAYPNKQILKKSIGWRKLDGELVADKHDTESDIFFLNTPTVTCKFILKRTQGPNSQIEAVFFPQAYYKLDVIMKTDGSSIEKFIFHDLSGNVFEFGNKVFNLDENYSITYANQWMLTSYKSALSTDIINFTYFAQDEDNSNSYNYKREEVISDRFNNYEPVSHLEFPGGCEFTYSSFVFGSTNVGCRRNPYIYDGVFSYSDRNRVKQLLPTVIESSFEKIEFLYDNLRNDFPFRKKLIQIKKTDKLRPSEELTISFNYDLQSNSDNQRLLLKSINSSINKRDLRLIANFSYYTSFRMPGYNSQSYDHWGYFNGRNIGEFAVGQREANEEYAKTLMLKTVENELGTEFMFSYEMNTGHPVDMNGGVDISKTIVGGGLRVSRITASDKKVQISKNYQYSENYDGINSNGLDLSGICYSYPSSSTREKTVCIAYERKGWPSCYDTKFGHYAIHDNLYTQPLNRVVDYNGASFYYTSVFEKITNGYISHSVFLKPILNTALKRNVRMYDDNFFDVTSNSIEINGPQRFPLIDDLANWDLNIYGQPLSVTKYSLTKKEIERVEYQYEISDISLTKNLVSHLPFRTDFYPYTRSFCSDVSEDYIESQHSEINRIAYTIYELIQKNIRLKKVITSRAVPDKIDFSQYVYKQETKEFAYGNYGLPSLVKVINSNSNNIYVTRFKYPFEYTKVSLANIKKNGDGTVRQLVSYYHSLMDKYRIYDRPIETVNSYYSLPNQADEKILSAEVNIFKAVYQNSNLGHYKFYPFQSLYFKPHQPVLYSSFSNSINDLNTFEFVIDNNYKIVSEVKAHDGFGRILEMSAPYSQTKAYQYCGNDLIATAINTPSSCFTTNSFEYGPSVFPWEIGNSANIQIEEGRTGSKSLMVVSSAFGPTVNISIGPDYHSGPLVFKCYSKKAPGEVNGGQFRLIAYLCLRDDFTPIGQTKIESQDFFVNDKWESASLIYDLTSPGIQSELQQYLTTHPENADKIVVRFYIHNTHATINLLIDECRIHPIKATIVTRTFQPFAGITSETDRYLNSKFYEYTTFGRIKFERNKFGQIQKYYRYHIK